MNFDSVGNIMLALGLVLPRVIGAFMMLPLITNENMPPLVRNSFMVSLAIIAIPVAMNGVPLNELGALAWAPIILKELFIGVSIGFCYGMVFWAISCASNIPMCSISATPQTIRAKAIGMPSAMAPSSEARKTVTTM